LGSGIGKGVRVVDSQKDRVLIVDDDRLIANTTALIFSKEGYEARAAYSAEEALALIREWPPSAAILDVHLPKMDGIGLARLMRLACPDCRVALISCQNISQDMFDTVPNDLSVIAKPVPPTELLAFVGGMLLLAR
jgi:DNA-binding response OmpR family regulator